MSATLVTACNAISGLDEDFRLGSGSTHSPEAGTSGASAAVDGSTADVVTADAADAPPGASASSWCPSGALFCENWDDKTTTWTREEREGGVWTVEPARGVAGSRALHAHADSVSASRKVVRWRTIAGDFPSGTTYTLTFKFRLASVGVDYAVVGAIQVNNTLQTNTEYGVAAYKSCPGAFKPCLDENSPGEEGAHVFGGQVGYQATAWHRAEVKVARNAAGYRGTAKVDDQTLDTNGETYFGTRSAPSNVEIGVGVFFTGNDLGASDVYIDEIAAAVSSP